MSKIMNNNQKLFVALIGGIVFVGNWDDDERLFADSGTVCRMSCGS